MANRVFIATSLDGFIATSDDGLEWLDEIPNPEQDDFGYAEFTSGTDCTHLGRATVKTEQVKDRVRPLGWKYSGVILAISALGGFVPPGYALLCGCREDAIEHRRGGPNVTTEYSIKGSSFKTKLEFVEHQYGERAREELEMKMEEEGFPSIFDSGWYPFTKFVRLLQIIAERHLNGDISRLTEVGEFSAKRSLNQTYKAYVSKRSFTEFLTSSVRMHRMLYSHGKSERSFDEDGCGCRIIYSEKPMISDEDLYVALGFFYEAGRMHGLKSVHGHFTTSNDGAVIALRWSEQ